MKGKLLLLLAAIILLTSCIGPKGDPGEGMGWFVKEYTITEKRWELMNGRDQLNSFFRAEIKIPELDKYVYDKGNVFVYMFQEVEGDEVQTLLPFTIPYGEERYNGQKHLWTETHSYDFTIGSIMIYVNYSDFYTSNTPPAATFRVVLNY